MAEFRMPSLGADMEEGTVLEWLVKPGEPVRRGDVVAVVDTTKAAVEVECFETGVVERLLVPEGQVVPVGQPLAVITPVAAAPDEQPGTRTDETRPGDQVEREAAVESGEPVGKPPEPPATEQLVAAVPVAQPVPPSRRPQGVSVTPIIRKLAAKAGVDLSTVYGSGRGGAITRRDLEQAVTNRGRRPEVTPYARRLATELGVDLATVTARPIRAADVRAAASTVHRGQPKDMRTAIAELMAQANRDIPHYYLATSIDMTACEAWMRERNRAVPIADRLVSAALLLKATALAARKVGELNGHWLDGHFQPSTTVDLGVATSLRGGGLLVPVLTDAANLPITELMHRLWDAVGRVRAGRPRSSDLAPASITVTNLGDLGVELVHGVIHPPQVALVGFGAVTQRPWAVDGLLGVRPVVTATLAADHRATDGAIGGRFLHAVGRLLQHPEEL